MHVPTKDFVIKEFVTFPADGHDGDDAEQKNDLEPAGVFAAVFALLQVEKLLPNDGGQHPRGEMDDFVIIRVTTGCDQHLAVPVQVDAENHSDDKKNLISKRKRDAELDFDETEKVWNEREDDGREIAKRFRPGRGGDEPADKQQCAGDCDEGFEDVAENFELLHREYFTIN